MEIQDRHSLGDLPFQDHRQEFTDFAPHLRACIVGCRVESRTIFSKYIAQGHEGSQSNVKTMGDLQGGFHFKPKSSERATGSWSFALPVVTTEANKKPKNKPSDDKKVTRTRDQVKAQAEKDRRKVKVRPVRNDIWEADERYLELQPVAHPEAPSFPKGTPGIVLSAMIEREQHELFLPSLGNALIAVNNAGDPALSTLVYDLTKDDELDDLRNAPLHSFWEVIIPGAGCAIVPADGALAWQLGLSGKDGIMGRGLVIDSAGTPTVAEDKELEPDASEEDTTRHGAVTFVNEYLARQKKQYQDAQNKKGKEFHSQVRKPTKSKTRTPPPSNDPGPSTVTKSLKVIASMSARASGPIEVGEAGDKHQIGTTKDGVPINAAHLSTGSLFKGFDGDGTLEFDQQDYEDDQGLPFYVPVKLRWDASSVHEWACGRAPGKWRWQAMSAIYFPETPPKTTTPGGYRQPPPWPPKPPPKQCQTIPGPVTGGGTGTGGVTVGWPSSGAAPAAGAGSSSAFGRMVEEAVERWGSPGFFTPVDSFDETMKRGQELFGGTTTGIDVGAGVPEDTEIADVIKGTVEETDDPPGTRLHGPGVPHPSSGGPIGGLPPIVTAPGGGQTTREKQKEQSRFSHLEMTNGLPIGSLSEGGVNAEATELSRLKQLRRIDGAGIPFNAVPCVGDSPKTLRNLLGGTESRYPTFAGGTRVAGAFYQRPFATAKGELDLSRGGFIRPADVQKQVKTPDTVATVAYGTGDGTWRGFTQDATFTGRQRTGPGGSVKLPARLGTPTAFADVLAGRYVPGTGDLDGTVTPISHSMPGGLAELDFSHPSLSSTRARGTGGTRFRHTAVGVQVVTLASDGTENVTPRTTMGEGGFLQKGIGRFTDDLTVEKKIDFTDGVDTISQQMLTVGLGVFDPSFDYVSYLKASGNAQFHQNVIVDELIL